MLFGVETPRSVRFKCQKFPRLIIWWQQGWILLAQLISITIQRANAANIPATIPRGSGLLSYNSFLDLFLRFLYSCVIEMLSKVLCKERKDFRRAVLNLKFNLVLISQFQ